MTCFVVLLSSRAVFQQTDVPDSSKNVFAGFLICFIAIIMISSIYQVIKNKLPVSSKVQITQEMLDRLPDIDRARANEILMEILTKQHVIEIYGRELKSSKHKDLLLRCHSIQKEINKPKRGSIMLGLTTRSAAPSVSTQNPPNSVPIPAVETAGAINQTE
jgi:hypothetical protein